MHTRIHTHTHPHTHTHTQIPMRHCIIIMFHNAPITYNSYRQFYKYSFSKVSDASRINCTFPDEHLSCHFPFTMKGKNYTTCISMQEMVKTLSTKVICLVIADYKDRNKYRHGDSFCYCDVPGEM